VKHAWNAAVRGLYGLHGMKVENSFDSNIDELRYLAQQLRLYAVAHERYDMVDFRRYLDDAPGGKLLALIGTCAECTRCPHYQSRKQVVFSRGDERSTLAFVGEAPGADEDAQGKPFSSGWISGDPSSSVLLDKMIAKMRAHAAEIGVAFPEQPYICNVLKCRPPGNKLLNDGSDIAACSQWLWQQLRLLPNVRVIVALGRVAAQTLLQTDTAIGKLRGVVGLTCALNVPVIATWHPSYLLRQPNNKQPRQESWSDLQRAVEALR